jgi:negative regulator of sigma-B (phosphoserine phosphatase)
MSSRARERNAGAVAESETVDHVEWSVATRCRPGEVTNGDRAVVEVRGDETLVAGIDGVGHGAEAARAATLAAAVIRRSSGKDLTALATRCHEALRDTRGAALSLVRVSTASAQLTWLGIGNVEGRLLSGNSSPTRVKGSLAPAPGVAGHHLPQMTLETLDLEPGDLLVLATDGVRVRFADALAVSGSTRSISERVLRNDWEYADDALVIAMRYLGRHR